MLADFANQAGRYRRASLAEYRPPLATAPSSSATGTATRAALSQLVRKALRGRQHRIAVPPLGAENSEAKLLRDLLSRTLTLAVGSLLQATPELVGRSGIAGRRRQDARTAKRR